MAGRDIEANPDFATSTSYNSGGINITATSDKNRSLADFASNWAGFGATADKMRGFNLKRRGERINFFMLDKTVAR
jgi:hypothetical protein